MKKKLLLLAGVLLLALAFAACGDEQNTKNYDVIAHEFVEALYYGEYDTCIAMIHEDYKADFTEENLEQMVEDTCEEFGHFNGLTEGEFIDADTYIEVMQIDGEASDFNNIFYYQELHMDDHHVGYIFLFEPETRKIVGISICAEDIDYDEDEEGHDHEHGHIETDEDADNESPE